MGALEEWLCSTHAGCLLPLMLQGKILYYGLEMPLDNCNTQAKTLAEA